jgi:hypothetical protein
MSRNIYQRQDESSQGTYTTRAMTGVDQVYLLEAGVIQVNTVYWRQDGIGPGLQEAARD